MVYSYLISSFELSTSCAQEVLDRTNQTTSSVRLYMFRILNECDIIILRRGLVPVSAYLGPNSSTQLSKIYFYFILRRVCSVLVLLRRRSILEEMHFEWPNVKCLAGFCFIFNTYFCGVLLLSVALNVSDHNYPLCLNFIAILTFTYFKKVEILCEIWLKCPKFFLMDTPKLKEYYTSKGICVYWDKTKTKEGFFGYPKGSK